MIRGLRVHVAGSAATDCEGELLGAAHEFLRAFGAEIVGRGGGLVLGAGGEPRGESGQPCIFDWTVLEIVGGLADPAPDWPTARAQRFAVVASQRGLEKIPEWRAELWEKCRSRSDFKLETTPAGWRMAGLIRDRQVLRGDILLALGGGAGTEHLAQLYREEGKPVIPIHAELGAITNDGRGGSQYLFEWALADIGSFFRLRDDAGDAAGRLSGLRLAADTDVLALAAETANLIGDLQPPRAFYVRLLATGHALFVEVEDFFRQVVDPVIVERGFSRREMGVDKPEAAFMNVEIFQTLHRASLVVADLTGVRPNCMMELGYALGRGRRVVVSAKDGTELPFDEDKLPTYMWTSTEPLDERIATYRDWLERNMDLPPLVEPTGP